MSGITLIGVSKKYLLLHF